MEDELELGDGFSGIEEEFELGDERSMTDEVTSPEDDYEDDESLAAPFGIGIEPATGYLNQRFTITIFGTPPGAKAVKLHTVKKGYGELNDPVIANIGYRNTVQLIGSTFLLKRKLDPTVANTVQVYARAYMPISWRNPTGRDKFSAKTAVMLEPAPQVVDVPGATPYTPPGPTPTPGIPERVCKEGTYSPDGKAVCRNGRFVPIGAAKEKLYLTPQEADALVRTGRPCYIKCMIPLLNMIPGIPYFTGCPILPGFVIQNTP